MMQHYPNPVSVGRIQYINVDPVYFAFNAYAAHIPINFISRPPAALNQLMAEGRLDISSVSSSAYARNWKDWLILPDLSIACYGQVMSVLAVSRYPFEALDGKGVMLTDESATAVDLLKLIFAQKHIFPYFQKSKISTPQDVTGFMDAGLVIGDAALRFDWRRDFPYVWDLCEIWNQMTGLPFVFGVWAVRRSFAASRPDTTSQILEALHQSRIHGQQELMTIARSASEKLGISYEICKQYFNSMSYGLGASEIKALTEFFGGLYEYNIIAENPELSFFNNACRRLSSGICA